MCGADVLAAVLDAGVEGSSPRVRGRLAGDHPRRGQAGLIPACAGQTYEAKHTLQEVRAHPRVCGADCSKASCIIGELGSSPRVRGRPFGAIKAARAVGLIPACAGQTALDGVEDHSVGAHPRVCGADDVGDADGFRCRGSSPRVRGRPANQQKHPPSATAHPRVCGADPSSRSMRVACPGSSPRVRGRQAGKPLGGQLCGLIPACAGQTTPLMFLLARSRAHPRVCGADVASG